MVEGGRGLAGRSPWRLRRRRAEARRTEGARREPRRSGGGDSVCLLRLNVQKKEWPGFPLERAGMHAAITRTFWSRV